MQRRRFLYAMVAGSGLAAGCMGSGSEPSQSSPTSTERTSADTPDTTEEPTTTTSSTQTDELDTETSISTETKTVSSASSTTSPSATDGSFRTISLKNLDDSQIPDEDDVSVDVTVIDPSVTADHTARIRATFANDGSKRKFSGFGRFMPLNLQRSQESGNAGLLLLPTSLLTSEVDASPYENLTPNPTNGCWAAEYSPSTGPDTTFTLDAGETVTQTLEIWDNSDVEGCMPPGTYQFTGSYYLGRFRNACEIGRATECNKDATEHEWTFTLSVK